LRRDGWLSEEIMERLAGGRDVIKAKLQDLGQQPDDYQPFQQPYYWGAFICQGDVQRLPEIRY